VLVTGASRGIGRAVALAFAAGGDKVALHYRSSHAEARRTLAELPGGGHVLVSGDLSSPTDASSIVDQAVTGLGQVDVLVNNAALAPTQALAHSPDSSSYEHWLQVWRMNVDINMLGAANLSFQMAQHLIGRSATGAIVNIGSRGAFRGEPAHPAYAASKAGLHALGQSLAVALAPHQISVTSIAPGFVATERQADTLAGEHGDDLRNQSPYGRVGTPEEVAAAVIYLASPEAAWASGTILDLNGASHLRQ
jgi:NAD(P)-dependent dehydrogenase (short-subunit alcohol dehydrogenase family)